MRVWLTIKAKICRWLKRSIQWWCPNEEQENSSQALFETIAMRAKTLACSNLQSNAERQSGRHSPTIWRPTTSSPSRKTSTKSTRFHCQDATQATLPAKKMRAKSFDRSQKLLFSHNRVHRRGDAITHRQHLRMRTRLQNILARLPESRSVD